MLRRVSLVLPPGLTSSRLVAHTDTVSKISGILHHIDIAANPQFALTMTNAPDVGDASLTGIDLEPPNVIGDGKMLPDVVPLLSEIRGSFNGAWFNTLDQCPALLHPADTVTRRLHLCGPGDTAIFLSIPSRSERSKPHAGPRREK